MTFFRTHDKKKIYKRKHNKTDYQHKTDVQDSDSQVEGRLRVPAEEDRACQALLAAVVNAMMIRAQKALGAYQDTFLCKKKIYKRKHNSKSTN